MPSPGFVSRKYEVSFDLYSEPEYVTERLLEREVFKGTILDPACGKGNIVKVFRRFGYEIDSSDIKKGVDFLKMNKSYDNVVTNPPFSLGEEFVIHALDITKRKVAVFLRLSFLEAKSRYLNLFSMKKLKKVYVFSKRVRFSVPYCIKPIGMVSYAWFVWDHNYKSYPQIKWIYG